MRKLQFIFLLLLASCAFAQSFRVTPEGRVLSESNCYSFEEPAKWYTQTDGSAPRFINFSPKKLLPLMDKLPKGGAEIAVVSAHDARNGVKSLDQWMELENRANSFTSKSEIEFPTSTAITKATKITWTQRTTESWEVPKEAVVVFFVFKRQPFRAGVEFNANDRKKAAYVKTLTELLESFRPLTDAEGTAGHCSKLPF